MQLTKAQEAILLQVVSGAFIEARRIYPFPHKWAPYGHDRPTFAIKELGEATVRALVNKGAVKPVPQDLPWDTIRYELTDAGRQATMPDKLL